MFENVSPSPDLNHEDLDPENRTRMIILGPKAEVSESEVVTFLHLLNLPITIKQTCYGAMVSGKKEDVAKSLKELRKLDQYNLFFKERGFPAGDPRRCRGHRKGPREGFHQLEHEFKLLGDVSDALKHPKKVFTNREEAISVDEFENIMNEVLENEK
jgi:putative methanogenesis marker protein 6